MLSWAEISFLSVLFALEIAACIAFFSAIDSFFFVDNAINHSIDTKEIDITLTDNAVLNVRNFGDVIEPEDIRHIWDRYYKVDKVHRRGNIGTGLGLSIVRSILELHGARYGVESQNGTTFWFELT